MRKKLNKRFLVMLSGAHHQSRKSIYEVAKQTGMSYNTVKKYVLHPLICDLIAPEVYILARYYGLTNDEAVMLISVDPTDESEIDGPVALPA